MNILVTGGAGFIGTPLVRSLLETGRSVTIYDRFDPQVHGPRPRPWRAARLRTVVRDVRDRAALAREVRRADAVVHFAASVGVGQSQYEVLRYVDVNVRGMATLLDILANERHRVRKVIVAGSATTYGEGAYDCRRCGRVHPALRTAASVRGGRWDPACPRCKGRLAPVATRESDPLVCTSVYAATKMAQEELALTYAAAYRVPVVSLRLFNVLGPGQSLSNPYTGVASIFMSRLKAGRVPAIYEDGRQTRDFVSVHDVVRACRLALDGRGADGRALNVGSGAATPVIELAERLSARIGTRAQPRVLRKFRSGDIRHCFADLSESRKALGFRPQVSVDDALGELVEWAASRSSKDAFDRAQRELARRGLV